MSTCALSEGLRLGEQVEQRLPTHRIESVQNYTFLKTEMLLTKYYPHSKDPHSRFSEDKIVAEIAKKTGWRLERADKLQKMEEETKEEVQLLRLFDPDRYFIGKIKSEKK